MNPSPLCAKDIGQEHTSVPSLPPTKKRIKLFAYILVLILLSVLRSATSLNYSFWQVDEPHIVVRALGFISGDLNPRWFSYHTLPMYLLSLVYYAEYLILLSLDMVSTKTEFASLVFSQSSLFFVPARLLFSFAHTLGCAIVALAAKRAWGSRTAAFAVFALAFLHPDAIRAGNYARVDSFVFLFLAAMIYLACFARYQSRTFFSTLICCAAAFASKFPAIVLYPILVLKTGYEAWRNLVPRRNLPLSLFIPPLLAITFMPYMLLDYQRYGQLMLRISSRASGAVTHPGKIHRYGVIERLNGLVDLILSQVGFATLVLAVCFVLWAAVSRDRRIVFCALFTGAYAMSFSTSTTVDVYWLRPVVPWIGFFAVGMLMVATDSATFAWIGKRSRRLKLRRTPWLRPLLLIGTTVAIIGAHNKGLVWLYREISSTQQDTRILAAKWIEQNLPKNSVIVLNWIPQYLPPLFSPSKRTTLRMSPVTQDMLNNALLSDAFDEYYRREQTSRQPLQVAILQYRSYDPKKFPAPPGSYVVISSWIYGRYFKEHTEREFPNLVRNAKAFYSKIRSQELVKHLEGRGPVIDIYKVRTKLFP